MSARPIPAQLRKLVLERDGYACTRCGRLLQGTYYSLHHRLPRSRGGKHTAQNLVTLCGSGVTGCHFDVESHRRLAAEHGWLLHSGADPARSPVLRHGAWLQPTEQGWVPAQEV